MKFLVTGSAGFIGYFVCAKLLEQGYDVVGIDNFNDYYSTSLKHDRIAQLDQYDQFKNFTIDLADREKIEALFENEKFTHVIHLAAQAGVRYSLENPHTYIQANIVGFLHILEGCRHHNIKHLMYASSSSVYGANVKQPFSESDNVDHPVSLYAASKKSNELMAHTYSHLYDIPTSGLRFFTVYGPWGRPDMALFKFTKGILEDTPIDVYNHGDMYRDFTYVDDIVESIFRMIDKPPAANEHWDKELADPATSYAPYTVYNIGNNAPVKLMDFIHAIEESTGKKAKLNLMPIQPGDVPSTFADADKLASVTQFSPSTPLNVGVKCFVEWYRHYYNV